MDTRFIDRLKEYDRDNIQNRIIDKIRKEYVTNEVRVRVCAWCVCVCVCVCACMHAPAMG